MNEIIEIDPRQQNLKTLGHISYSCTRWWRSAPCCRACRAACCCC